MLRMLALLFVLSGCSIVTGSEAATATDLCDIDRDPRPADVRVLAVVETDGHHGMFLSSEKCRFKLRVGKASGIPDESVEQFMLHVSKGGYLTWRKYSGEFLGRIVTEDQSKVRFELLHVYWFRDAAANQGNEPKGTQSKGTEVVKPIP